MTNNFYSIVAVVQFEKVEILCPGRPGGNIEINLSKVEGSMNKYTAEEFKLKEDSWTQMKLTFKVHNNIVLGLKLVSAVKAIKLMKDEEIVGTYPPTKESHEVLMDKMHTPSGFFSRGSYNG